MAVAPNLRIAILECDTPLKDTREKYGGYGGVFKTLLHAAARHVDLPEDNLILSNYDVVERKEYPNLEDIDAVLITGSRHNSFEDHEWILKLVDFTKKTLSQDRVRIIGVCFGHQIVGRAMNVRVGRSDIGWEVSVYDVDLTAKGKELFGGKDKIQMHRDIVYELPDSVELLGSSPRCEIQGMFAHRRLITVQGHPEFTAPIVREIVHARHEQKIFDEDTFRSSLERLENPHDGVLIAAAFLKFLLDV